MNDGPAANPSPAFGGLPRSLAERSRTARLAGVPALLCHPDGASPAPVCLWLHGRTATKEMDPGRYARWIKAGVAACALDLPGHGERLSGTGHDPQHSLATIRQMLDELPAVIDALGRAGPFDTSRLAIGGMSLGGMITLRRLCDGHAFRCAAVEGTTGSLHDLYFPPPGERGPSNLGTHAAEAVRLLDPAANLAGFRPIPLLAVHSEADAMVPWPGQRRFLAALRAHYEARGAAGDLVRELTWPETGAPQEHIGFGRYSNDAKNAQADFLAQHLLRA